jgi:hypothetical protein
VAGRDHNADVLAIEFPGTEAGEETDGEDNGIEYIPGS